ncbi:hypothetical protein B0T26DRAFT_496135 [Lasiosphaeria miniovina]|uniref:Secreted protein n=1 Tax=Lasiosphaeria miniovina TaxID=1954250 RepID=A0AA39ZTR2_9PEZI|nr:uncharacterized protein B0T26DRAFT_496135 [Lasiosphaeria miniovina]KAK0703359.1 hypothetical protein B0T26DRAFT_496135 [Lasiosphaeria miniovina]
MFSLSCCCVMDVGILPMELILLPLATAHLPLDATTTSTRSAKATPPHRQQRRARELSSARSGRRFACSRTPSQAPLRSWTPEEEAKLCRYYSSEMHTRLASSCPRSPPTRRDNEPNTQRTSRAFLRPHSPLPYGHPPQVARQYHNAMPREHGFPGNGRR